MSPARIDSPQAADNDLQCGADVLCLGCGCLCDDIQITLERGRLQTIDQACELGQQWFWHPQRISAADTTCRVRGKPASLADAIAASADILRSATSPLVFGLSRAANQSASAAVALAERLGAFLDLSIRPFHRAWTLARQHAGDRTATLGFVRNHASLVVFIGCDPMVSHPRHFERYSGGQGKSLILVGSQTVATDGQVARHISISPHAAYHSVQALRSVAGNIHIDARQMESLTGLGMDGWRELHAAIVQASLTAIFLGQGECGATLEEQILFCEAALRWGAELNRTTRVVTLALGDGFNATGAIDTLTWQTGFPFAVDFSAGFPQYDPIRFSVDRLLADDVPDAALIVDASPDYMASSEFAPEWRGRPCIVVGSEPLSMIPEPKVWIPTSTVGVDCLGTVHRSDHLAWQARPWISSPRPTSAMVLTQVMDLL